MIFLSENIKRIAIGVIILVAIAMQFGLMSFATSTLSTQNIAWGFRRGENGNQPSIDSMAIKLLNEFDRLWNWK